MYFASIKRNNIDLFIESKVHVCKNRRFIIRSVVWSAFGGSLHHRHNLLSINDLKSFINTNFYFFHN